MHFDQRWYVLNARKHSKQQASTIQSRPVKNKKSWQKRELFPGYSRLSQAWRTAKPIRIISAVSNWFRRCTSHELNSLNSIRLMWSKASEPGLTGFFYYISNVKIKHRNDYFSTVVMFGIIFDNLFSYQQRGLRTLGYICEIDIFWIFNSNFWFNKQCSRENICKSLRCYLIISFTF